MCRFKPCEGGARCGSHPRAIRYRVPDKLDATRKATLRALKLFCVGFVLQGGFFQGVRSLTFGVDIAQHTFDGYTAAYLVRALCQIWLKGEDDVDSGLDLIKRYRYQLLAGLLITIAYMALLYGTYVPNWEYRISGPGSTKKTFTIKCGVRGDSGQAAMQLA
ncbi:heparan-alpha-glucosaminide N-acetyltransferase [Hordeum vulgare]|nr:heparan-alpha-glucosaminide N-acetyltransferase [Hordeum vulgare]